jgi:hypothetical protein
MFTQILYSLSFLLLFSLLFVATNADICMLNGIMCKHNDEYCYGSNCPTCHDKEITAKVVSNLNSLSNLFLVNNITSSNTAAVYASREYIDNTINYCNQVFPVETIEGGLCLHNGNFCNVSGVLCYEQDCVKCNDKAICTTVNDNLNSLYGLIEVNSFTSNINVNSVNDAYNTINTTINYCNQYSMASIIVVPSITHILVLLLLLTIQ